MNNVPLQLDLVQTSLRGRRSDQIYKTVANWEPIFFYKLSNRGDRERTSKCRICCQKKNGLVAKPNCPWTCGMALTRGSHNNIGSSRKLVAVFLQRFLLFWSRKWRTSVKWPPRGFSKMIMNLLSHTLEWPQQLFNNFCCYLEPLSYGKRLKYP
jgi:hypothetical protein